MKLPTFLFVYTKNKIKFMVSKINKIITFNYISKFGSDSSKLPVYSWFKAN